ncbi:hypothetical protein IT774_00100 [Salinimonas marina]|uniref:Uncharacterized protein n=1 Tax=Salinimonas marina TaxID=2785918 RepID=A0A7S9HCY4_9ALTE|nr:hypothetical protein [Salinimonas marina]QPG05736.1 hypothetical protein IT774_00100 [Salinimonas marina]
MHESIAKAQVKGMFRVANDILDSYNTRAKKRNGQGVRFTRKRMTAYVSNIFEMYGDLLLYNKVEKRKSSWHFNSLNLSINPDPECFVELGVLHCIISERVISRYVRSGKVPYHHYSSKCYLHEHFLQRIFQRASALHQKSIKNELVSISLWLSQEYSPTTEPIQKLYFVSDKHVVVMTYHLDREIYIFNTILKKDMFTTKQEQKFSEAYSALNESEGEFIYRNEAGDVHLGFSSRDDVTHDEIVNNTTFFNPD